MKKLSRFLIASAIVLGGGWFVASAYSDQVQGEARKQGTCQEIDGELSNPITPGLRATLEQKRVILGCD